MGSLFKLRDHWYTRYGGEEFSHTQPLAVGNIDNHASGENKIIIGSFSGLLRIMQPMKKGAALPEDTLLEKDLGEPILQLACRPLELNSKGVAANLLAVLFPKRLALFRVRCGKTRSGEKENSGAFNASCSIHLCYKTSLEGHAYNFTCGAFGGAKHEMVCVQSMDGQLTIVDRNLVLLRFLLPEKEFLLPGCLTYCRNRDCFLTCNSSMKVLCYKFSALTNDQPQTETQGGALKSIKSEEHKETLTPLWAFPLGEDAIAIEVCRFSRGLAENDADIVILCQYALFVLKLNGQMRYSKRLDVAGLCLTSYDVPAAGASNVLVGTATGSVLVFSDTSLEWSAKMTEGVPLCMEVTQLMEMQGLVVSLNTEGTVAVNYLGTDPEEEPIQPLQSKEVDYAEAVDELRRVQQAIKRITNAEDGTSKTREAEKVLEVTWDVIGDEENSPAEVVVLLVIRNCSKDMTAFRVTALLQVVIPIEVDAHKHTIESITPGGSARITVRFSTSSSLNYVIPSSLDARVVILYTCGRTTGCSVGTTIHLPFTLVAQPIPYVDASNFVLQFDTNKSEPPSLIDVFTDFAQSEHISSNLLAIQYVNGAHAVLFVSRNAGRFRLQASTMEALWLFTFELHARLLTFYDSEVQFTFPNPIPLDDYFRVIDEHVETRKQLNTAKNTLAQASQMFFAVQKRLLALFRTNSSTSVALTSTLLGACYGNLQRCTDTVCRLVLQRKKAAASLCCCSRLVVMDLLIKCQKTLTDPEDIHLIESIFTCSIDADDELDWEESTDAALGRLVVGNKGSCDFIPADLSANDGMFVEPNVERLRKRITEFFDKLLSGALTSFLK